MPLQTTPRASTAAQTPGVGVAGAGKKGRAGSTNSVAAHIVPCALAKGSTVLADFAYRLAML